MKCTFEVLGVRVDAIQMAKTVEQIESWIQGPHKPRYVAVTGMHGIAESRNSNYFRQVLNAADLVVPDGAPLVWLGRLYGCQIRKRVCGPDLLEAFCSGTGDRYRHFFYGGAPGVATKLAEVLRKRHGITVAGTHTPPFRPLTEEEETELALRVEEAAPDVLWVGLSTPKQERWMYEHRSRLRVPVMLGVGAAFDINSGRSLRAPRWMGDHGLEWLFRLATEPTRLWKRYLVWIPKAVLFASLELIHASRNKSLKALGDGILTPTQSDITEGI